MNLEKICRNIYKHISLNVAGHQLAPLDNRPRVPLFLNIKNKKVNITR